MISDACSASEVHKKKTQLIAQMRTAALESPTDLQYELS